MTKLNVENKKNNEVAVAVELENGRFEITENGVTKEVAASTFKRWYKVIGEAVQVELEELLQDAEVVEVQLTQMEKMILNGMRSNEYNDAMDCPTYVFTAIDNSGLDSKQARGVISSLVKKDIVFVSPADHYNENETIGFTEKGTEVFETADGEDCSWGGPKLLKVSPATPVSFEEDVTPQVNEIVAEAKAEQVETRGGKCEKIVVSIEFGELKFVITEYDGFVCDVTVNNLEGKLIHKSKKMSIKDALENLGYAGDKLKEARKQIMHMRKVAKQAI